MSAISGLLLGYGNGNPSGTLGEAGPAEPLAAAVTPN
jgi:hypothetical protein